MRDYDRAVWLVELLCCYHPYPVPVLLGKRHEPSSSDWLVLLAAERGVEDLLLKRGVDTDKLQRQVADLDGVHCVIKAMGGWGNVTTASEAVMADEPTVWYHFAAHLKRVEGRSVRPGDVETPLSRLADELGIHPNTLVGHRSWIPRRIARYALSGVPDVQGFLFGDL